MLVTIYLCYLFYIGTPKSAYTSSHHPLNRSVSNIEKCFSHIASHCLHLCTLLENFLHQSKWRKEKQIHKETIKSTGVHLMWHNYRNGVWHGEAAFATFRYHYRNQFSWLFEILLQWVLCQQGVNNTLPIWQLNKFELLRQDFFLLFVCINIRLV